MRDEDGDRVWHIIDSEIVWKTVPDEIPQLPSRLLGLANEEMF